MITGMILERELSPFAIGKTGDVGEGTRLDRRVSCSCLADPGSQPPPQRRPSLPLADSDTSLACPRSLWDNGSGPGRTRGRTERSMAHSPHINPYGIPLLDIGRDVHGRFTKANPGGPGNPFARKVAALRKALLDSVTEQDVKDVAEILKLKAKQGDMAAVKLMLQYCVGK